MNNTIHPDNRQVLTYEKGVNGDISPSKKYEAEGSAYRLINCRINPLTHLLENVEGIDTNVTISVLRDGIKPVTASRTVLNSVLVGDMQVLALAGATPSDGQIAIYLNDQVKIVAQHADMALYEGQVVDMSTDGKDEVYLCGSNQPNLFLSVSDLLASVGTEKYFTKFELDKHIPRVGAAMGVPMYVKHENIGSALGLKAGSYVYFLRLVDPDGNRTPWSQSTPLIPVAYDVPTVNVPGYVGTHPPFGNRAIGVKPNGDTSMGIRLRFRVDGTAGFSYAEIGRMAYNTGQPIGFLPNIEVTKVVSDAFGATVKLDSVAQVVEFIDTGRTQYIASDPEADVLPSQMENCNNVTYYDGRVIYSGIKYKKLDLSHSVRLKRTSESSIYPSTTPNTCMYPFTEDLGAAGHSDITNQIYKKCDTPGDYRNYAIILWDGKGGRTPALPLDDLRAYKMSNLRDKLLPESEFASADAENMPRVDNTMGKTLDIYQYAAGAELSTYYGAPNPANIGTNSPPEPVKPTSNAVQYYSFNNGSSESALPNPYKPGFNLGIPRALVAGKKWRTIGNMLQGVDTSSFPDWVDAFSIVASDTLGAVVFTGLAMYNPEQKTEKRIDAQGHEIIEMLKSMNTVNVHTPMLDINPELAQAIIDNPSNYKMKLLSPVSFLPEMARNAKTSVDAHKAKGEFLVRTHYNNAFVDGAREMGFGLWMNKVGNFHTTAGKQSAYEFPITSASIVTRWPENIGGVPKSPILSVSVGPRDDIYPDPLYATPYNTMDTRNDDYYEPWYIVNIVRTADFDVVSPNISTYKSIGHYQKLNSVIGIGTGATQEVLLVDERPEDAIGEFSIAGYLKVDGKWWMHLSVLDQAIVTAITNNGFYTYKGKDIYGLYTHKFYGKDTYIKFSNDWEGVSVPVNMTLPRANALIEVVYNNDNPIKLFSGDSYVGMAQCMFAEAEWEEGSITYDGATSTRRAIKNEGHDLGGRFLYRSLLPRGFGFKNQTVINEPSLWYEPKTQLIDRASQVLVSYPIISKVNVNLAYDGYPVVNYRDTLLEYIVEKPEKYLLSVFGAPYYNIFRLTTIGQVGGFTAPNYNLDYTRVLSGIFTSLPIRGFTEITYFPNRLAWSNRKQESVQDVATNKTFSALAVFDLPSASGDITYITAANNVLTVFTENDIAKIPINRYTLSNVDGSNMGVLQTNRFIGEVGWLNANLGIPKDRRAMVADFMGSVIFITKDNEAYLLTDKLSPVSTGFRWKLNTIVPNEVLGIARGFYRKDLGEVWIPNATGFMVYSLSYQSWYSVVLDASYAFVNHKAPICFKNGVFKNQNGTTDFANEPLACRAYFVAQPLPSTFKSFVYLNMYGSNVNEIELWANKYHNVIGATKAYSDVLKVRGNNQWAYFPSDEKPPYNRCQADWVIMAIKGSPLPISDGKFSVTTIEVGSNKIV